MPRFLPEAISLALLLPIFLVPKTMKKAKGMYDQCYLLCLNKDTKAEERGAGRILAWYTHYLIFNLFMIAGGFISKFSWLGVLTFSALAGGILQGNPTCKAQQDLFKVDNPYPSVLIGALNGVLCCVALRYMELGLSKYVFGTEKITLANTAITLLFNTVLSGNYMCYIESSIAKLGGFTEKSCSGGACNK